MNNINEFEFSTDQLQAIDKIINWYNKQKQNKTKKQFRLYGPAGSGKTSLVPFVIKSLNVTNVQYLAPTGKSVLALKDRGVSNPLTIHKAMYILPDKIQGEYIKAEETLSQLRNKLYLDIDQSLKEEIKKEIENVTNLLLKYKQEKNHINLKENNFNWTINPNSPLFFSNLIVCDESSMINGSVRKDLESFNKPIIYIGDPNQLPPINMSEMDNVIFRTDGSLIESDYTLTTIHRQAMDNPILRYSQRILEDDLDDDNFIIEDSGYYFAKMNMDEINNELHIKVADQIVCGYNKTRIAANNYIRRTVYGFSNNYPEPNDKIIIKRNNYDSDMLNGDILKVTSRSDKRHQTTLPIGKNLLQLTTSKISDGDVNTNWYIKSNFVNEESKLYVPKSFTPKPLLADYGWVISVHNAQGSEWNSGLIIHERFGRSREDYLRWLYTAVTRFKHSLIIFS